MPGNRYCQRRQALNINMKEGLCLKSVSGVNKRHLNIRIKLSCGSKELQLYLEWHSLDTTAKAPENLRYGKAMKPNKYAIGMDSILSRKFTPRLDHNE